MSKKMLFWGAVPALPFLLILFGILFVQQAQAVPPFARQTESTCNTCHFQHFPKLNSYGRLFKAAGLSISAQRHIEDDKLSIPASLNATFFMRSKYLYESDVDVPRKGTLAIPEEAAILVGGRLAEGVGGIVEWGGPLLSSKLIFTRELAATGRLGLTAFTTDGLGAGYGFEVMNTGAVRNHRPFEQSSKPTLGNNGGLDIAGAATGVTVFSYFPSKGFISATLYAPDSNEAGLTGMDVAGVMSQYLRAAYMPQIGGWDAGLGAGMYSGSTKATLTSAGVTELGLPAGVAKINTNAWFVDAQMQGSPGGHDTGVYFMYAVGDDPTDAAAVNEINLYGSAPGDDKPTGWGLDLEYSLNSDIHLLASAGSYDDGSVGDKQMMGLGAYFKFARNITMQPMFELFSGDQGVDSAGDDITRISLTLEADF